MLTGAGFVVTTAGAVIGMATLTGVVAQRLVRGVCPNCAEDVLLTADQVAELDGRPVGKPGSHARAVAQLSAMSGRVVVFHTAVAVVRLSDGFRQSSRVPVTVRFRSLPAAEIEAYLHLEQPYDCAGSAKCETLGIALLSAIESDDPTALVGLPLIRTCEMLRAAGINPLARGEA